MIQIDRVSDNEKCTFNKRVLKEYFKENKRTNTQLDKIEFTNESMTINVKPWLGTQKIGEQLTNMDHVINSINKNFFQDGWTDKKGSQMRPNAQL